MANADTSAQPVLAAARFGRRSSKGVLFGLSRLRLATVAGAFVFGASPVWGSALLVAYVPVRGRTAQQERWPCLAILPGCGVVVDEVTGSAMVHDPYDGTLTAAMKVGHGAFVQGNL